MNRFSPTQRRACLVLVVCVLAVILTFLGAWVVLPGVLGAGSSGTGDYDPELYPVDTSLDAVLPQAASSDSGYLSSTVFVGDQYTTALYENGQISLDQYLGAENLSISNVLQTSCVNFQDDSSTYTIPQALAKMKPRRIVVTLGRNDVTATATAADLITNYRNVLKSFTSSYSYCDVIVNAIPPVTETTADAAALQTVIDETNQQLALLCNEAGYKFLNSAEVLKADSGFADASYFEGDTFNASGARALLNYVTSHAYDAEDRRPDTNDIPLRATQASASSSSASPTPSATPTKHTVRYSVEDSTQGTLTGNNQRGQASLEWEVDDRATASVTAVPAEGYEFRQWSDGQTNATRFDIVTQDISVTAMFEKETTVAVTIEEGNTTMRVGDTLVLHANLLVNGEAGDNDMIQWAVNGELQHNGYSYNFIPTTAGTYTVRAGAEVDGVFASQEITVTVEQPVTSVSVTGYQSVEAGATTTLTASVENGSGDTTWSCPQMPNWSATGDSVQFTPSAVGTYTVQATNNGVTTEFTITATAPAATASPAPTEVPQTQTDRDDD